MDAAHLSANMKAPGILSLPSPADWHLKDVIGWQPAIVQECTAVRPVTCSDIIQVIMMSMRCHLRVFASLSKYIPEPEQVFFYTVCYTVGVNEVTCWQGSKSWVYTHSAKTFYGSKCLWNHPLSWPVSPGFCRHFIIVITKICDLWPSR